MDPVRPDFLVSSDASDVAVGAIVAEWGDRKNAHPIRRPFTAAERQLHINQKEVLGFRDGLRGLVALLAAGKIKRPRDEWATVYRRVDNTTLLYGFKFGVGAAELQRILGDVVLEALRARIQVIACEPRGDQRRRPPQ